MRLYQQLILFMLAATVPPLAVVGFWLLRESEAELKARIQAEQRAVAGAAAEATASQLIGAINAISRSAELIQWQSASPEEVKGGLSLLYEQSPLVGYVSYLAEGNAPLSVYRETESAGHPAMAMSRRQGR